MISYRCFPRQGAWLNTRCRLVLWFLLFALRAHAPAPNQIPHVVHLCSRGTVVARSASRKVGDQTLVPVRIQPRHQILQLGAVRLRAGAHRAHSRVPCHVHIGPLATVRKTWQLSLRSKIALAESFVPLATVQLEEQNLLLATVQLEEQDLCSLATVQLEEHLATVQLRNRIPLGNCPA